jgi:nucleotide-binding universal stress UspA family protein
MPAVDPSRRPAPHRSVPQRNARIVLVGVDGSTTSLRAATYACGMARRELCRLIIVHVMAASSSWGWATIGTGEIEQQTREELDEELRSEIGAITEDCPVPITFVSMIGHPTYGLSAMADEVRADLVVVGASRGWRRRCGTSVATRLIRLGRWPVIVIP